MVFARPLAELIAELERLPGVGPKSAQRLAYHLLRVTDEEAGRLAGAIRNAKEKLRFCADCQNISETEICEICRSMPEGFVVLSGDDSLTLPVMAVGGRGIVSVASNAMPREMSRMVELAESGDFASARKLHNALMPFMTANFVEANPIPIKAAMALLGLMDERYRLPMVPPQPASRDRIAAALASVPADAANAAASRTA